MNPLNQFEAEQKMLSELKDLFAFAKPEIIRRNLEDLFFLYMSSDEDPDLPDQKAFIANFYYLINFLNEMDSLFKEKEQRGG